MHNSALAFFVGALVSGAVRPDAAGRQAPQARAMRTARSVRAVIRAADVDQARGPRPADHVAAENDYYRFRNQPRG
jgi:hypothetical protein